MTCFVYAETYDPPINFWSYYKEDENINDVVECSINDIEYKTTSKRCGNGFFVNINDKVYVITCSHIIGLNNVRIFSYNSNNKNGVITNLKVHKIINDFDIAILEVEGDDITEFVYPNNQMQTKKHDNAGYIIKPYVENNGKIGQILIKTTFQRMENLKFITEMVNGYELPFINLHANSTCDLHGFSGSIVKNNDTVVGMVMLSDVKTNVIHVMPFSIVIEIVKACIINDVYDLSVLIFNSNLVAETNESHEVSFYGHMITKSFGIQYSTDAQKSFTLKDGDIIISVNNNPIKSNGNIFCEELNLELKIKTYTMLQFIFKKFVNIEIIRKSKKYEYTISGVNPQMYFSYNFQRQKTFLCWNGLIFIELSEDIMKYFKSKGISLVEGKLCTVNTKQKKYIAIVNVNDMDPKNERITILEKVGNSEVANLQSLKKILNKKSFDKTTTISLL